MSELILHIGTTKTGTSSLQRFLFDNRERLAEEGVAYPVFSRQPGPARNRNGIFLDRYCGALARSKDPGYFVNDSEENLELLAESLSGSEKVLLTDENFSYTPGQLVRGDGHAPRRYWQALADTVRDAGAATVTVVVYLRRQDDWIASRWRQNIRSGTTRATVGDYCKGAATRYCTDYSGLLAEVAGAFGEAARIVVRRYDRASFEGGDIYHDFCAAIDLPWDDGYPLPEREVNQSLAFDVAEALRPLAKAAPFRTTLRTDVLMPLAQKLSRQNPDPPGMTPFDEDETRSLMEPHLPGNERVSDRYLGGEPLFSDEYGGRPVWVPDGERIAEYRTAFERAIREHPAEGEPGDRAGFARRLARRLRARFARGR